MGQDEVPQLVNIREMARILNLKESWLYERTRKGAIPCVRLGKYLRFDPQEVLAFFRSKRADGSQVKDAVS